MPVPTRVPVQRQQIVDRIVVLRGLKVLLDHDLAVLYRVEVRALNQAVKRNIRRFPADFAFRLTPADDRDLKSQVVTSTQTGRGGRASHGGRRRSLPMAFTEQGVAMLSSVLHSPRAVRVNIEIMRTFVRMRQVLAEHADLARRIDELEGRYDEQFRIVFDAIRQLIGDPSDATDATDATSRAPIGFQTT